MRIFFHSALTILLASLFFAPAAARALGPGGDLYFGYSRSGPNNFIPNTPAQNGWEATGSIHFLPLLGVEADVARYGVGAATTAPRTTTALFGPRLSVGLAGIHVFARGLVGVAHTHVGGAGAYSTNPVAGDLGGGLDFRVLPFFAWRVVGDYITTTSSPANASHYRLGTGLVFRF